MTRIALTTNDACGRSNGRDEDDRDGGGRLSGGRCHSGGVPASGACDIPDPTEVSERLVSLLPLLARHEELDVETIGYHARQSDATARDGYWHAAINEARSFLEALVTGIALVERAQSLAEFRKARGMQGGIRVCRRYLLEAGFLDIDEDALLAHVYGIASAKGSHLGVADEAWCRLARRIVHTTAEYLLHRYAAWQTTDHASRSNARRTGSNGLSYGMHWRERLGAFLRGAAGCKPRAGG